MILFNYYYVTILLKLNLDSRRTAAALGPSAPPTRHGGPVERESESGPRGIEPCRRGSQPATARAASCSLFAGAALLAISVGDESPRLGDGAYTLACSGSFNVPCIFIWLGVASCPRCSKLQAVPHGQDQLHKGWMSGAGGLPSRLQGRDVSRGRNA